MQELIQQYIALNDTEKEYFLLSIIPQLCKTFQTNPDSMRMICRCLKDEILKCDMGYLIPTVVTLLEEADEPELISEEDQ